MNTRSCTLNAVTMLFLFTVFIGGSSCSSTADHLGTPLVLGLDHISLVVADLEGAAERYRELGFVLKPGRMHENGIQNQHVKFPDGTEIELISTSEARDPLTAEYLRHLALGDGPAFVSFFALDMDLLANHFDAEGRLYQLDGGLLSFFESDEMRYIFFGSRTRSPTDQPEHFEHLNAAEALIGVWIAGDDLKLEYQLLSSLGAAITQQEVHVPESLTTTVAMLQEAEVIFLPGSWQIVPGRRIVGATIHTNNLDALWRVLTAASLSGSPVVQTKNGRSIFIPPGITHGIWLEFRQDKDV